VLLVDDDAAMLRTLSRALRNVPVRLQLAASGEEAVAWLKAGGVPVAVVSDLKMGLVDGFDVLRAAARLVPAAQLALHTGETDVRLVLESGQVVTVFTKPASMKLVRHFVSCALG